jgi:hypothetical protein
MPIDRVGKGPGPLAPEPASGAGASTGTANVGATFEVERAEQPDPADATRAVDATDPLSPASPLSRLRAGEIDLRTYIELKVDEETAQLRGLAPDQLEFIKGALRDRMRTDPAFMDLVRTATGHAPSPPED